MIMMSRMVSSSVATSDSQIGCATWGTVHPSGTEPQNGVSYKGQTKRTA